MSSSSPRRRPNPSSDPQTSPVRAIDPDVDDEEEDDDGEELINENMLEYAASLACALGISGLVHDFALNIYVLLFFLLHSDYKAIPELDVYDRAGLDDRCVAFSCSHSPPLIHSSSAHHII